MSERPVAIFSPSGSGKRFMYYLRLYPDRVEIDHYRTPSNQAKPFDLRTSIPIEDLDFILGEGGLWDGPYCLLKNATDPSQIPFVAFYRHRDKNAVLDFLNAALNEQKRQLREDYAGSATTDGAAPAFLPSSAEEQRPYQSSSSSSVGGHGPTRAQAGTIVLNSGSMQARSGTIALDDIGSDAKKKLRWPGIPLLLFGFLFLIAGVQPGAPGILAFGGFLMMVGGVNVLRGKA